MNSFIFRVLYLRSNTFMISAAMNKNNLDIINKIAFDFAIKNGFDTCSIYSNSGDYTIYVAEYNSKEPQIIGYPSFIIIDVNEPRFATQNETYTILGISNVGDNNFSETL